MTITPFLAFRLRSKKDAIKARLRARRVAKLLHFDPYDQACIAAGAFVIACQGLSQFPNGRLCFQIENQQLQIFTEAGRKAGDAPTDLNDLYGGRLPPEDPKSFYRLVKPLPPQQGTLEESDLRFLVKSLEAAPDSGVFDEIARQNQEVLSLLSELRLYHAQLKESGEKSMNPNAA